MSNFESSFNNLPNRLTIFRVFLIPFILGLMTLLLDANSLSPKETLYTKLACIFIFGIASITDFFDGYIARKKNLVSLFGSFLDPIADKFLVVSILIMLLALKTIHPIVCILIVLREIYIVSLRLLATHQGIEAPVNWLGKVKTALQMISIPLLIFKTNLGSIPILLIGKVLLYISLALSILSAITYSIKVVDHIQKNRRKKVKRQ